MIVFLTFSFCKVSNSDQSLKSDNNQSETISLVSPISDLLSPLLLRAHVNVKMIPTCEETPRELVIFVGLEGFMSLSVPGMFHHSQILRL